MNRKLLVGSIAAATVLGAAAAGHADPAMHAGSATRTQIAVIGDTPYGPDQLAQFPALITAINRDTKVRLVTHLGDIKNGSTRCDDSYFATIAQDFTTFKDPLVYTPGDNDWTDCHRPNNGGYNPLERLAKIRATFFPKPGHALGGRKLTLDAQPGLPENQRWTQSGVVFAAVHVVGSNNSLAPWTGNTAATPEQRAEAEGRIAQDLAWIDRAFEDAARHHAAGVALLMQADTFEGENETLEGLAPIVTRIGERAAAFGKPVLLLQGDSHRFTVDHPYPGVPNLTRVIVEGEQASEWLRLTVDPRSGAVFSWERESVPATTG